MGYGGFLRVIVKSWQEVCKSYTHRMNHHNDGFWIKAPSMKERRKKFATIYRHNQSDRTSTKCFVTH